MARELYRALSGSSLRNEGRLEPSQMARMVQGVFVLHPTARAARLVGVSPATWRSWATGRSRPRPENLSRLQLAVRWARLDGGVEQKIRRGDRPHIRIDADVTVSNDKRRRTLNLGDYIEPDRMRDVMSAYLRGDDNRAGRELMRGIHADYVAGMRIDNPSIDIW